MILILKCRKCGRTKRIDDVFIDWRGHYQSKDGKPVNHRCTLCQKRMTSRLLQTEPNPKARCGKSCMRAVGAFCTCSCNGKNHGINYL